MGLRPWHILKKNKEGQPTEYEAVKEGFSLWFFIFDALWALMHRAWRLLILVLALNLIARALGGIDIASPQAFGILLIGFKFAIAFHAWTWRLEAMMRRGWEKCGIVMATDEETALIRYLDGAEQEQSLSPTSSPWAAQTGIVSA